MVTSIDDMGPDGTPDIREPQPTPFAPRMLVREEAATDPYAEAELRLRHERTERFIQKANREQA